MNQGISIIKDASERLIEDPSNMLLNEFLYIISTRKNISSKYRCRKIIAETYATVLKSKNIDLELKFQLKVAVSLITKSYI